MRLASEDIIFIFPVISLVMTFCWALLDFRKKYLRIIAAVFVGLICLFSLSPLIIGGTSKFNKIIGLYSVYPIIILTFTLLGTLFFTFKPFKENLIFMAVAYALNSMLLLYGFELLKSSGTTWGNFSLFQGIVINCSVLFVLQLLTYTGNSNLLYGILKCTAGSLSFLILFLWGLNRGSGEWVGNNEIQARRLVIFISVTLIIEGLLLIYKAKKANLKKQQMA